MDPTHPQERPLEQRKMKISGSPNGVLQQIPAVHPRWSDTSKVWMILTPVQDVESAEVWREQAEFMAEDLDFILSLDYHEFWSQILFDPSLRDAIDFWLQKTPRAHDEHICQGIHWWREVQVLSDQILRKLFLVILRMATHKESTENFMSPEYFGKTIYDNFVFDIPRMIDICALFAPHSHKMVSKVIYNIFKHQPNYNDDLRQSILSVMESWSGLNERISILMQDSLIGDHEVELADMTSYVLDVTLSLNAFLMCYPPACNICHSCNFESKLANLYQTVIVVLVRYANKLSTSEAIGAELSINLNLQLCRARKESVDLLRQIINTVCLQNIPDDEELAKAALETYFEITSNCLSEGILIVDYCKLYPLQDDFEVFKIAGLEVDTTRVDYVVNGIKSLQSELEELASVAEASNIKSTYSDVVQDKNANKNPAKTAAKPEPKKSGFLDIDLLITQVKDLFPDLGDGYVESCLQYFDNDLEKVINSLLENNLPPHLLELDRATVRDVKSEEPKRRNIYDNDEFDINARDDIDLSKVHRGKKKTMKSAEALLNDKSDIVGLKDKFAALGIVTDEVIVTAGAYDADYDDEYDDTYDDITVGQGEPDAKDDVGRPFVLPRALGGGHVGKNILLDSSEEEEEDGPKKDHFIRNPAEIREENERKRQLQQSKKSKPQSFNRDVIGKPKGQGQDKNVTLNRSRKNANKGKNYRAMADKKQSKGMF